jgi:hypothetical protein
LNVGAVFIVTVLAVAVAATSARGASPPETVLAPEGPVPTVAVLRPASDDPVLVEAATRIQMELGASGSPSALVDAGDGFPARVALVRVDGVAIIDVLGTLADGGTLHRRVPVPTDEGGGDPAVIAVRAVEILRGIGLDVRRARPAALAKTDVLAEPELASSDARAPERADLCLAAGLAVLSGRPVGAALAVGPTLAASAAFWRYASVVASFAGPFSTTRPPTVEGSAHTREELGVAGLRVETRHPRWNVHAMAAVGLHHLSAGYDDRGLAPGPPHVIHVLSPQSTWTPVVALTAGASARLWRRLGASLALTAVVAQPAIEIVANGRALGTIGAPSFLPTLSAWLAFP